MPRLTQKKATKRLRQVPDDPTAQHTEHRVKKARVLQEIAEGVVVEYDHALMLENIALKEKALKNKQRKMEASFEAQRLALENKAKELQELSIAIKEKETSLDLRHAFEEERTILNQAQKIFQEERAEFHQAQRDFDVKKKTFESTLEERVRAIEQREKNYKEKEVLLCIKQLQFIQEQDAHKKQQQIAEKNLLKQQKALSIIEQELYSLQQKWQEAKINLEQKQSQLDAEQKKWLEIWKIREEAMHKRDKELNTNYRSFQVEKNQFEQAKIEVVCEQKNIEEDLRARESVLHNQELKLTEVENTLREELIKLDQAKNDFAQEQENKEKECFILSTKLKDLKQNLDDRDLELVAQEIDLEQDRKEFEQEKDRIQEFYQSKLAELERNKNSLDALRGELTQEHQALADEKRKRKENMSMNNARPSTISNFGPSSATLFSPTPNANPEQFKPIEQASLCDHTKDFCFEPLDPTFIPRPYPYGSI